MNIHEIWIIENLLKSSWPSCELRLPAPDVGGLVCRSAMRDGFFVLVLEFSMWVLFVFLLSYSLPRSLQSRWRDDNYKNTKSTGKQSPGVIFKVKFRTTVTCKEKDSHKNCEKDIQDVNSNLFVQAGAMRKLQRSVWRLGKMSQNCCIFVRKADRSACYI